MAARVAARLSKETGALVRTVRGGLGEFSVYIGERKVVDTNRLWYPTPASVVRRVKQALADPGDRTGDEQAGR
jgi:hypothetical protein